VGGRTQELARRSGVQDGVLRPEIAPYPRLLDFWRCAAALLANGVKTGLASVR
jgi:hypothetical protein